MAPIKLWALDGSPPSWAVRMVADILGLQLEIKNIDFVNKEHKSPEILKLNPMGTIPIIQDGDFVISESHTIIKYLLEKYGSQHKERLYPSEIRARALADQAMFFDTGVVFIRVKIIALPAIYEGVDRLLPEVAKQVDDAYEVVNRYLERSAYVAAEHLTIADITMGASVLALDGLHPVDKRFPKVLDWLARLKKEPYFNKIAVPGAATLAKTVEYYWDMNKKK